MAIAIIAAGADRNCDGEGRSERLNAVASVAICLHLQDDSGRHARCQAYPESVMAVLSTAAVAVAAFALSAFGLLLVVSPPGSDVGAEHHNRLFGVAVLVLGALTWAMLVSRTRVRAHHPLVA